MKRYRWRSSFFVCLRTTVIDNIAWLSALPDGVLEIKGAPDDDYWTLTFSKKGYAYDVQQRLLGSCAR